MYSITKRGMEFEAIVRYQDGHEERFFPSVEEAEQYVIESAKFWNHTDITVDDIAYFEEREIKVKQDFVVDRDEFTGLFCLCCFSRSSGWFRDEAPVSYVEAVKQWNNMTFKGKRYTKERYDSDLETAYFYKIMKDSDAQILPS